MTEQDQRDRLRYLQLKQKQSLTSINNIPDEIQDGVNAPSGPISESNRPPAISPMDVLSTPAPVLAYKGYQGIQNIFKKGGEAVAETLAGGVTPQNVPGSIMPIFKSTPGKGVRVNPTVAGIAGGVVENLPDIASMAVSPEIQGVAESALPMARRALGFSKQFLKTPFARGQATKAAEVALEKGVIGSNPQSMFDKATELASKSGEKIKSVLKNVPANFDQAASNLEKLRGALTSGTKEGALSKANTAIDDVQASIRELSNQVPSLEKGVSAAGEKSVSVLNKLKNRVGKSINYLADLASQGDNKAIQNTLANSIRDMVKKFANPQEFISYLENQRLFNAAELMKKGLNNELAGQMGNSAVSLPGVIVGAAQGNVPQAVAATGLFEGAKRAGAGIGANIIQGAYKQSPRILSGAASVSKNIPKKIEQNGHIYYLNERTGQYE